MAATMLWKGERWLQYIVEGDQYVPMEQWGKDHWSTLAYLECRVVDHGGEIKNDNMRCNARLHRELLGPAHMLMAIDGKKYPTFLAGGKILEDHDDWSCVEDMAAAGLLTAYYHPARDQFFGGMKARVVLTAKGMEIAAKLRVFKAQGGNFAGFQA